MLSWNTKTLQGECSWVYHCDTSQWSGTREIRIVHMPLNLMSRFRDLISPCFRSQGCAPSTSYFSLKMLLRCFCSSKISKTPGISFKWYEFWGGNLAITSTCLLFSKDVLKNETKKKTKPKKHLQITGYVKVQICLQRERQVSSTAEKTRLDC